MELTAEDTENHRGQFNSVWGRATHPGLYRLPSTAYSLLSTLSYSLPPTLYPLLSTPYSLPLPSHRTSQRLVF